ncbi:MAG: DUF559 domain-containing protein [Proteobacteria bacterium]|nr:DUF559 domain-containing protein [Pseudomonadota bacterium]
MQARGLHQNSTEAERILWRVLRELRFPVKVRRQHPIDSFIVDFAIPAYKLAIEIDGGQHALNHKKGPGTNPSHKRSGLPGNSFLEQ